LWQVTVHSCLDAVRRLRRRPALDPEALEGQLPAPGPSPLDRVLDGERAARLLRVLEAMPAECRELWRLILRGLGYREIAAQMGVAEGALRVRAHRCRKRAEETLARLDLGHEGNVGSDGSAHERE
jgi:RNA polymerase sigma factor (sigma-70 family)